MPRKGHIAKRTVESDPVYGSDLVTKFINSMMWQGKKSTAENIFYKSLEKLQEKGGGDEALKLFTKAVENAKPLLEVKTRRVGGANYQVDQRVARCCQRQRCRHQEERRRPQNGGSEQGFCALSLVEQPLASGY